MNAIDRRRFLRSSAIFVAGSSLPSYWSTAQAATNTVARSVSVRLSADDQTVLSCVAGYSAAYRLQGGCVLGKLKQSPNKFTQIVAAVSNPAQFAAVLGQKSPLGGAFVNGDQYSFQSGETLFTLQNSSTGLPAVPSPDWLHQAIQYDPSTQTLTDPLGATGSGPQIDYTLRLVAKTRTIAENFLALTTGLFESSLYRLTQDASFNTFRNSVLNTKVTSATDAMAVNIVLVQNLAALAQVFPANSFGAILQSPLLAGSIATQCKLTAAQMVARFAAVRPKVASTYSDEAVWLAILLPAQKSILTGDLTGALSLSANLGFNAILSLDALAAMREVLKTPAFAS
jgi:hypothetical protein